MSALRSVYSMKMRRIPIGQNLEHRDKPDSGHRRLMKQMRSVHVLANSASRGSRRKENSVSSRALNTSAGNTVFLPALTVCSFALGSQFGQLLIRPPRYPWCSPPYSMKKGETRAEEALTGTRGS